MYPFSLPLSPNIHLPAHNDCAFPPQVLLPFTVYSLYSHVSGSVWRVSQRAQRRTEFKAWKVELAVSRRFWSMITALEDRKLCAKRFNIASIPVASGVVERDDAGWSWMARRSVAESAVGELRCWQWEKQVGASKTGRCGSRLWTTGVGSKGEKKRRARVVHWRKRIFQYSFKILQETSSKRLIRPHRA